MEQLYCLLYTRCLMQLSVACNFILEGVRMITWRWIISHKWSWITVYVYCCNAQSNLIGIMMSSICIVMLSQPVNCPAVICSPNMLSILRRTPLVNCGPRSNLYDWYIIYCYHLLSTSNYYLPHYTFNPLFLTNQWDWQPHCKLRQSLEFVLCGIPSS